MDVFRVRRRLWKAALWFLEQSDLSLSIPGRAYLSWLLTRASARMVAEGHAGDEDQISRAQEAVTRLLAMAAGAGGVTASSVPLGLFFGAEYAIAPRRITLRALRAAIRDLCPGFYPIC